MTPQRRKLLLALRRRLKASRHFTVDYSGSGNVVGYTCKTCGARHEKPLVHVTGEPLSDWAVRKMVTYWQDPNGNGVSGECPTCTRRLRDERYPLR